MTYSDGMGRRQAIAVEFDLADEQSIAHLVDSTIAEFGAVHGLHNVGADLSEDNLGRDTTLLDTDLDVCTAPWT